MLLDCALLDSVAAGSEASDSFVDSTAVSAMAGASPGKTSRVISDIGVTLGAVTTTHCGPDHVPPLLRRAPSASHERLATTMATTNKASNLLFILILQSYSW